MTLPLGGMIRVRLGLGLELGLGLGFQNLRARFRVRIRVRFRVRVRFGVRVMDHPAWTEESASCSISPKKRPSTAPAVNTGVTHYK